MSLKLAIERLIGGTCYHMHELYQRTEHVTLWVRALKGETQLLPAILDGYCAAVDWPASALWKDAAQHFPDAKILLSRRASPEDWWDSVDQTVWEIIRTQNFRFSSDPSEERAFAELHRLLTHRFCLNWDDADAAQSAYAAHLEHVRTNAPKDRLFEFKVGEGWDALCQALQTPVPDGPFPNKNARSAFKARNKV